MPRAGRVPGRYRYSVPQALCSVRHGTGRGTSPTSDMAAPSEDAWTFDVAGFVHLPSTLSPQQVVDAAGHLPVAADAAAVAEAVRPLRAHPKIVELLPGLGGGTQYRLDHPPRMLPGAPPPEQRWGWLTSDAVQDAKRLGYDIVSSATSRSAHARGFRVLWVLEDTSELGAVTGSHKSSLPPPTPTVAAEMQGLVPLHLRKGDLVLAAATTLFAWLPGASSALSATPQVLELVLCFDSKLVPEGLEYPWSEPAAPLSLEQNLLDDKWNHDDDRYLINPVRSLKRLSFSPFYTQTRRFAKTGSGQS